MSPGTATDVESMPRLPTFPARWVLDDPRGRAYFVFWTGRDGDPGYPLRMMPAEDGNSVIVGDRDGRALKVQIIRRPLPQCGGMAILYRCPECRRPRRYLYGVALLGGRIAHDGT